MEHFAVFDPYTVFALGLVLLLSLCLLALFEIRDRQWTPPHPVSESVWCPAHGQRVVVDFVERVETGLTLRSVEHCPLRGAGERCGEECRDVARSTLIANPLRQRIA